MSINQSFSSGVGTLPDSERYTTGPLLVATDGSRSSDSAFPAALLLADRMEAAVDVLSVAEPLPVIPSYPVAGPTAYVNDAMIEPLLKRSQEQVKSLGAGAAGWPIAIETGNPVAVIAREARERKSRMIVIGLNHHDRLDRFLGGDTMLGLIRRSDAPILAVSSTFKRLPRHVVIAVDFSPSSAPAIRTAMPLLDEAATVYLVHVAVGSEHPLSEIHLRDREYDRALPVAFEAIMEGIDVPAGVSFEQITLWGNPAKAILEFAESVNADLLVAGSHGRGAVRRLIVGSVATHLLRGTPCSIMIVPRTAASYMIQESAPIASDLPTTADMSGWSLQLRDFTRRNASRQATLEVDDPEIGAQAEVTDYPFLGADFDRHSGRVEIMLGDAQPDGRHLTHSVSGVTSIDVMVDSNKKDSVLRLAHGTGQTLLTFV